MSLLKNPKQHALNLDPTLACKKVAEPGKIAFWTVFQGETVIGRHRTSVLAWAGAATTLYKRRFRETGEDFTFPNGVKASQCVAAEEEDQ